MFHENEQKENHVMRQCKKFKSSWIWLSVVIHFNLFNLLWLLKRLCDGKIDKFINV